MSNLLNNPSVIAAESLTRLQDQLVIASLTARDKTADFMQKPNGYAVGSSVSIKQYGDYDAKEFTAGGSVTVQDVRNSLRSMTIEKHFDVSVEIGAKEQALSFDGFSKEVLQPAMATLAEKIDTYCGTKLLNAAGLYASDSLFTTAADMSAARKAATLQQLLSSRICLTDLDLEATILGLAVFNQSQTGGSDAEARLRNGLMGRLMGMDFFSSIGFPELNFTASAATTTVDSSVATNNLVGLSVLTVDATDAAISEGDRVVVAGLRRPMIVGADAALGATSITLKYPITELIEDGAAVTIAASGQTYDIHGAIMDDKCLAVAMPMLDAPSDKPSSVVSQNGFSLRVVRGYEMSTKKEQLSIDCLVGAEAWDPRRITLLAEY